MNRDLIFKNSTNNIFTKTAPKRCKFLKRNFLQDHKTKNILKSSDIYCMDVLTKEQRRKNMQAIKSKGTKIEVILSKALWSKGYRYRKNNNKIFGRPDFIFTKYKVAIFCDSEYFHGKDWENAQKRIKTNQAFWHNKIEGNIRRDQEVNKQLTEDGWIVLRFWGEDIKKNIELCVLKISKVLMERQSVKYSELREKLKIESGKSKFNSNLANLTHYLQNKDNGVSHHFKPYWPLFFDIVRILEAKRPKAFMLENVKNLVSHDKGNTFRVIRGALEEIVYSIHYQVLDGRHARLQDYPDNQFKTYKTAA